MRPRRWLRDLEARLRPSWGAEGPRPCLCPEARDPAGAPDKVQLRCPLELGRHAPPAAGPPQELLVAAYNLERGLELEAQLDLFASHPLLARADLLLLSELDRGCSRTGGRNVADEVARALGMDYAYGVDFVELPRRTRARANRAAWTCEHGNAVLSRHPLRAPSVLRHRSGACWWGRADEPRLGGSVAVRAEVELAGATLRVYALHLDSGLSSEGHRRRQAAEVVADAAAWPGPLLVGGDTNAYAYGVDLWLGTALDGATQAFLGAGYADAHARLPARRRGTTDRSYLLRGAIDLVFVRGLEVLESGIVAPREAAHLSDHLPVWSRVRVPQRRAS